VSDVVIKKSSHDVENGVWLHGSDADAVRAVSAVEKRLKALPTPLHYTWRPVPRASVENKAALADLLLGLTRPPQTS